MKAIIYGRERTIKKLTGLLEDEGIEVKVKRDGIYKTMDWQEDGEFDLAIVDGHIETAGLACRNIRESGNTPIALLVDPRRANWKQLEPLDADCYLPETKENGEMAARLRAILRRYSHGRPAEGRPVSVSGGTAAN